MSLRSTSEFREFLWRVAPALVYAAFLFWLAAIHTEITIAQDFVARDKLNHFAAFGVLTLLALRALRFEFATVGLRRQVAMAIALSSAVGALLEMWQLLFPYRSSEFLDWVADTLGAVVAGSVGYYFLSWWERHVATSEPKV